MARMVGRPRIREGRGIGERMGEFVVFAVVIAGAVMAGYWYFVEYRRSPAVAIQRFLADVNRANVEEQHARLASSSQSIYPLSRYRQLPFARGLSARIASYTVTQVTEEGDTAEATVDVAVRRLGQELYEAGQDRFRDVYALKREPDGWKVVLERSRMESAAAATRLP